MASTLRDLRESKRKKPIEEYHATEFWKKLEVGVVTPVDAATVLIVLKDLCRHFVSQNEPELFIQKAAKLAMQFRRLDEDPLTQLLVDHAGLQELCTLNPKVHFDIEASSWDCEFSDKSESPFEEPFTWRVEEPLTECSGDSPDSPLRLSFSDDYYYIKEDQRWLEGFIRSVDRLTETQALIFGPAFASLFVILRVAGNFIVGKHMSVLCTKLKKCVASLPEVAQQLANLDVKMPPPDKMKKLLQVYVDVKLPPIFMNTAFGGFLHVTNKQEFLYDDVFFLISEFLRAGPSYYGLELAEVFLDLIVYSLLFAPRPRHAYFAFVLQCFPESWKAIRRLPEKYTKVRLSSAISVCEDPLWEFAGVFSDTAFDDLSYDWNHQACNISTVLYDLLNNESSDVRDWPVLGPSYQSLIREKPKWMRISRRDAILAENLNRVLRMEIGERNPKERVVTVVNEDADSLVSAPKELVQKRFPQMLGDIDARKKGFVETRDEACASTKSDLLTKPFVVFVRRRAAKSDDDFFMAEEVRAFDGFRYLERVSPNCLKAEFDNVYKAVDFLLATEESATLRTSIVTDSLFRYGIIRDIPISISVEDILKELRKESRVETVGRLFTAVNGLRSILPAVELRFWDTELPLYVMYRKIRIPLEPSSGRYVHEYLCFESEALSEHFSQVKHE